MSGKKRAPRFGPQVTNKSDVKYINKCCVVKKGLGGLT